MNKKQIRIVIATIASLLVSTFMLSQVFAAAYPPAVGGTGTSTTPRAGQVLIGVSTSSYGPAYLTAGNNVTITTSSGSITITATSSGLTTGNFASANISQWTNNSGYLTTSTGLTTANFASANISQWTNNSGYVTSTGSGALSSSSVLTAGYFPYWANATGGLNGTSSIFYSSSTGNIGIQTTQPSSTLHIVNTSSTSKTLIVNNGASTGNIFEAQDNGTAVLTVADGGNITVKEGATIGNSGGSNSKLVLSDAAGTVLSYGTTNVTLGTNVILNGPSSSFSLISSSYVGARYTQNSVDLILQGTTAGNTSFTSTNGRFQLGTDVNGAPIAQTFKAHDGITGTDVVGAKLTIASGNGTGAASTSTLNFATPTATSTGTTAQTSTIRMTIDQNGRVGIGTQFPSSTLHIAGNFQLSASSSVVTPSIGGGALLAGACASATSSIDISVTSSTAVFPTTPQNYPGAGFDWHSYLSATGVLTTEICAEIAATPTATAYNVKILK